MDLKKPESVLVPAYDDALGVTAAFNLNLLVRINRELGGEFDLGAFRHKAVYNPREGRIEMHLESRRAQTVAIRSLEIEVPFAAGETIHTESSYKFDREQIAALAADTGFEVRQDVDRLRGAVRVESAGGEVGPSAGSFDKAPACA